MALTAKKVYAILKRQISDMEAKLNSPVRYRGTVATADLLPLNPDIGDMYNIESKSVYGEAGMNVAWNGVVWDTMGAPIDMSLYLTKEEAEAVIQRLVTEYFEKNPVKPGATTEQAQQIERNKTDIASLKEEIYNSQIIDDGWEIGTFDTTWGVKYDGTTLRARLENVQDKCNRFSTPSNFSIVIFGYKPNGEYVGIWNGTVFEKTYKPISGGIVSIDNILKDYSGYSINIAIGNDDTLTDTHTISDNVVFYNSKIQQIETNKNDISELREDISTKITKFYASSQGKTHLADSDNGKIMDMMLYGKSEQKQYSGKNLLKPHTVKSETLHGVTCTYNNDGSVSLKGTAENDNADFYYFGTFAGTEVIPNIDKTKTYTLAGTGTSKIQLFASGLGNSTNGTSITSKGNDIFYVMYRVPNGITVDATIYPQIELGSEPTSYEPYTGGIPSPNPDYPQEIKSVVNPTVKVCGKNLLKATLQTTTVKGVTCTNNGDGTYTLNGTATATGIFVLHSNIDFTGQMRLCGGTSLVSLQYSNSSNFAYEDKGAGIIIEHFDSVTYPNASFNILIKTDNVYNNALVKPMLTTDLTATYDDFEPYHEQTVTLPYTLNAIPVNSGGNVTIDGQQYIADYVDVERGKLVRRADSSKLDNTQSIVNKTEWLLAEPQEIDLTQEEVQALKTLVTYYPTTNISVNSEQLDGYTVFNYPISMANGWNYVKKQLNDNRDYIYDMDVQSAEAYVNSEYAVALTELEV